MRIAHFFRALVAVLGFAAVFPQASCYKHMNSTRISKRPHKHHRPEDWNNSYYNDNITFLFEPGKFLNQRDNQMLLREEREGGAVDCCPSVLEMVEPLGGKNQEDQYVLLYRDNNYRQRFYELSCHVDVQGKPCRFMDKKLHNNSMCIQKYSYTYALVKDLGRHHHQRPSFPGPNTTSWTLDYIRVRSGCGCVVTPNAKKKRDKHKIKKNRYNEELNR